jgi:hypothetical protein
MKAPTKYLMYNSSGNVVGTGYTPDGTIPADAIACTDDQAKAWSGSTVANGAIVAAPAPTPAQQLTLLKRQATAELKSTDTAMLRIAEGVALGLTSWTQADVVTFVQHRRAVREILRTTTLPTPPTLPARPAYPMGS